MKTGEEQETRPKKPPGTFDGRDEMNLVECPLSSVADRFLDGRKTVVFQDQVWDTSRRAWVKRELAISGSDRYGLPTALDEDVLLACVQLSALQNFQEREVHFSRYELLKLLRWPDEGKSYQRLGNALRRWKGVTVYSDRAFYDHGRESWVTRDFGVFDNLSVYERESAERAAAPASSWFVWNEVFFDSFRAGYLKRLDWDFYCRLKDPVAKRLYRLLDKRFYKGGEVVFDLRELAIRKVRLSETYDTAQIKRALANGIRELEAVWELNPLPAEKRFRRVRCGEWQVVFTRRRGTPPKGPVNSTADAGLVSELVLRGITRAVAEELAAEHSVEGIKAAVSLFDWYASQRQARGAGFLVDVVRNPNKYHLPAAFLAATRPRPEIASSSRNRPRRDLSKQIQRTAASEEKMRWEAFTAFWDGLTETGRVAFESAAHQAADPTKRDGFERLRDLGGPGLEAYRQGILRDHFERTRS